MKYVVLIITGLIFSANVYSVGLANEFQVDFVRVDSNGKGYVQFMSPLLPVDGTLPSCAVNYPNAMAFDTNTPGGKSILAVVLSAKMSGKNVLVRGVGTCVIYGQWAYGYVR